MDTPQKREWLNQDDYGRLWTNNVLPIAAALLPLCFARRIVGLLAGSVLGATGAYLAWLWLWWHKLRAGILMTDRGFTEWFWTKLPRRVRWEDVRQVDEQPDRARIVTATGAVELDDNLRSWRRLLARARQALGEALPDEPVGPPVAPEQVEEWLGIEPGGSVRASSMFAKGWAWCLLWLLWVGIGIVVWLSTGSPALALTALLHQLWRPLVVSAILVAVLWWQDTLHPLRIIARGDGLELRSWRRTWSLPWHSLRGVRRLPGLAFVSTADRGFDFWALDRQGKRLLNAIEQAIAARAEGLTLPRVEDVPQSALSTSNDAPEEALVQRGLTAAEE